MPLDLNQAHDEVAWSHWLAQFPDGSRLEALVRGLVGPLNGVQAAARELLDDRWLDTAEGVQLDGIGDIVGLPRTISDVAYIEFFGFVGQPGIDGFGQGRMRRDYESTVGGATKLLDAEYRRLLYWKIAINNGHGTAEEIIAALKPILDVSRVIVQDIGNAKIAVWINGLPTVATPLRINAKRWVPKAAGVGLVLTGSDDPTFGFVNQGFFGFGVGMMARGI